MNTESNAAVYKHVCEQHVTPVYSNFGFQSHIFMQDNDPMHKAKLAMNDIKFKEAKVIDWPTQSPDINQIRNLWKTFEQNINC